MAALETAPGGVGGQHSRIDASALEPPQTVSVVIYLGHAHAQMPLVRFIREVLELEPEARAKALAKVRKLEQGLLAPLESLNPKTWCK